MKFRKIYQCWVRPALLYCCETWEVTVADEARLCGVEHHMIQMCGVFTDVLRDRVCFVVKIEDIIQSCLWWCGHVMHGYINSQIRQVIEAK